MDLRGLNYFKVEAVEPPPASVGKRVVLSEPKWVKGALVRQFAEVPRTKEELSTGFEKLRRKRNILLRNSDFSQIVSDISPERKEAYATYRQALRDLPANTKDPYQADWPKTPEGK